MRGYRERAFYGRFWDGKTQSGAPLQQEDTRSKKNASERLLDRLGRLFEESRLRSRGRCHRRRLLPDLDDTGRDRAHEENVTAAIARRGNNRLDGALRGDAAAGKLAKLEHGILELPLSPAADGAWVAENVLEMRLKSGAAFLVELHKEPGLQIRTWITLIWLDYADDFSDLSRTPFA